MAVFGCATDEQLEYELLENNYCEQHLSYYCEYKRECESSPRGFYPAGVECRLSKEFKEHFNGK